MSWQIKNNKTKTKTLTVGRPFIVFTVADDDDLLNINLKANE